MIGADNPEISVTSGLLGHLMDVMEHEIVPRTRIGVAAGNKIFGAAILRKADLALVVAETNNELENPLWHGEMHCLKRFFEIPEADRPEMSELIFLTTHEPCSLCLSAITWAGFDNFFYFFSHEDSRDSFAIPHDLNILREVFRLPPGGYKADNAFWTARSIRKEIKGLPAAEQSPLDAQASRLKMLYEDLSEAYQAGKDSNSIPLA